MALALRAAAAFFVLSVIFRVFSDRDDLIYGYGTLVCVWLGIELLIWTKT